MTKKVISIILVMVFAFMNVGSFAISKSIVFPKEGLPSEVIYTDKNGIVFKSSTEKITITKLSDEKSKNDDYSNYTESQKKYLYTFHISSGEGQSMFDFVYVKYTGKNGIFNVYGMDGELIKNSTLTISKDGSVITVVIPNSENAKKPYKFVYKKAKDN